MSDPHAACMNFLNALQKLPDTIRQHQERADKQRVDVPTLEAIVSRTWGKEDELKALKATLAALDHKITAELAPKHDATTDGEEIKPEMTSPNVKTSDNHSETKDGKESMVAEPAYCYASIKRNDDVQSAQVHRKVG